MCQKKLNHSVAILEKGAKIFLVIKNNAKLYFFYGHRQMWNCISFMVTITICYFYIYYLTFIYISQLIHKRYFYEMQWRITIRWDFLRNAIQFTYRAKPWATAYNIVEGLLRPLWHSVKYDESGFDHCPFS